MPLKVRSLGYLFVEGLAGIKQNGLMSLASISTVAICLFLLAVFLIGAVNLQNMADILESQVEVVAYLNPDFDRKWEDLLLAKASIIKGVSSVEFVSKDEALLRLRRQFGDKAYLLDAVERANPLRDSLEVKLLDPAAAAGVVAGLEQIDSVQEVSYKGEIIDRVARVAEALKMAGLTIIVMLAMATVFLVANTVRLTVFARRREIAIMRLVGATTTFIRLPFLLEGLLLGVTGAAMAAAVTWYGYDWFLVKVTQSLPFIPIIESQPLLTNLSKLLLVTGAGIGGLGSLMSVQRHLNV